MLTTDDFEHTHQKLKTISPSFCAAKWLQVTLHLGTGTTHSCHHPAPHEIPLEELKDNPSALHNTKFKKQQRKMMLEGERPKECDYCWRVEDSKQDSAVYSDRITKSSEVWAAPHLDKISTMPWDVDINPTYLEVDFDTTCNFKCAYCSPSYSTTWMQEIKKHGPYVMPGMTFNDVSYMKPGKGLPFLQSETNPYIDAFWKWIPDAIKDLQYLRVTGGEPLLSKHTYKILDYLIENPQPEMEFGINSNLCAPKDVIDVFIEKMKIIQENKCVKSFKMFTSCEAYGEKAEYIRFGMNYEYWRSNLVRVIEEIPRSFATVMATYNVLSVTSFTDFLKDMLTIKQKYATLSRTLPLSIDVPYVRYPPFLAGWIITENFIKDMEDSVTFMYRNRNWGPVFDGFYDFEVNRMERLYYVMRENMGEKESNFEQRRNFYEFIQEYDKRRGTDFFKTFPELKGFYYYCKDR